MNSRDIIVGALRSEKSPIGVTDFTLDQTGEDSFHLVTGSVQYAAKMLPKGLLFGENELRMNRDVLGAMPDPPAPRVKFVIETPESYVVLWEWVDGANLGRGHREYLPIAFERLGEFHLQQRNFGPVHSLYAMRDFPSIREMIESEMEAHCRHLHDGRQIKEKALPRLRILENGYPTLSHGDMHPSNVICDGSSVYFIDWANGHNGLGLMDLDRIHTVYLRTNGDYADIINPQESRAVLESYFRAAGIGELNIDNVQHAVMLLNQLRLHSYGVEDDYVERRVLARKNIDTLLGYEILY